MSKLSWLLRRHPILSLTFVVAAMLTLVFVARLAVSAVMWSGPAMMEQPPAGWMTPRYVAMSWHVPQDVIAESLGIEREGSRRRITLAEIAENNAQPLDELLVDLEAAIADYRQDRAGDRSEGQAGDRGD